MAKSMCVPMWAPKLHNYAERVFMLKCYNFPSLEQEALEEAKTCSSMTVLQCTKWTP